MAKILTVGYLQQYDAAVKTYIDGRDGSLTELATNLGVSVNSLVDGINKINSDVAVTNNGITALETQIEEIVSAKGVYVKTYLTTDFNKLPVAANIQTQGAFKIYVFTQGGELAEDTNDGADTIPTGVTVVGSIAIPADTFTQSGEVVKGAFEGDPAVFTEDENGEDTALKLVLSNNQAVYIDVRALATKIQFTDNEFISFTKSAEGIIGNIEDESVTIQKIKDADPSNSYNGITNQKLDSEVTDILEDIPETTSVIEELEDDLDVENTLHAQGKTVAEEIADTLDTLPLASAVADGRMSKEDKAKLDSIALDEDNAQITINGNTYTFIEYAGADDFDPEDFGF